MAGAISQRANKLAQSLLAFAFSAALMAEPAMAQAQDDPAAPTAPATDAEANAAAPAAGESYSRAELEKLLAPIALSRPPAGADAASERLSRADRPGAALARQEQGARRQEHLFRNRQPELGSGGEGACTLS